MRRRCGHRRRMILGHPRADMGQVTRTRAIAPDLTLDKARATVPDPIARRESPTSSPIERQKTGILSGFLSGGLYR